MATYDVCTDRGSVDLTVLRQLLTSRYQDWTSDQKSLWTGEYTVLMASNTTITDSTGEELWVSGKVDGVNTQRAAWNYTDCNRIRTIMLDIADRYEALGYTVTWPYDMIAAQTQAATPGSYKMNYNFLANLRYIRNLIGLSSSLPSNMSKLNVTKANQLEQCLLDIDERLIQLEAGAMDRYCGDEYSGSGWYG